MYSFFEILGNHFGCIRRTLPSLLSYDLTAVLCLTPSPLLMILKKILNCTRILFSIFCNFEMKVKLVLLARAGDPPPPPPHRDQIPLSWADQRNQKEVVQWEGVFVCSCNQIALTVRKIIKMSITSLSQRFVLSYFIFYHPREA